MCTYYIVAVTPEACVLFSAHVFSMIGPVGGFRMEFITNVDRILLNTVYECDTVLPTVTPRSPFNNSSRSASITAALWSEEYMNKAFDAVCVCMCVRSNQLPSQTSTLFLHILYLNEVDFVLWLFDCFFLDFFSLICGFVLILSFRAEMISVFRLAVVFVRRKSAAYC